jgi:PAS domain S-box-containing protein
MDNGEGGGAPTRLGAAREGITLVSWHAVAMHFADRGSACALLDRGATVRLFSAGLEELLGWPREEIEGRSWSAVIAPPAHANVIQGRIERALNGTLRSFESEAAAADGRRFRLVMDAALVGRDDEQSVLLSVASAQPMEVEDHIKLRDEIDYEVSASVSDFGRLFSVSVPGRPENRALPEGARCHDLIQGHATPCEDCPLLRASANPWPRTTVRRASSKRNGYEVVTAEPGVNRVRVRLRRISEDTISAIYESRVRDLADRAQLSGRERAVLTYLLMGRSLADIATILSISPRTVKFHQANVLEKLGADSRADLIRLIT